MKIDTWTLAEKIEEFIRTNKEKMTQFELTNAIDNIIRDYFGEH